MAELIPWSEFEEEYAENFSEKMGAIAKPFRMALGSLIIKEKLGTSDRETVEQIRENPYLQYFLGMSDYSNTAPFDASLMVYFRERIDQDLVNQINRKMVKKSLEKNEKSEKVKKRLRTRRNKNRGKLILDATCAPGDISYPTDLGILKSRESANRKNSR